MSFRTPGGCISNMIMFCFSSDFPKESIALYHWSRPLSVFNVDSPLTGLPRWCKRKSLGHTQLFATPWIIQSVGFSRPEYWSGEPFPSPGDLPNPGIEPRSPTLQVDSLLAEPPGNTPSSTSPIESTRCCRRLKRRRFDPWVGKISWSRKWQQLRILAWKIPWTDEATVWTGRLQSMCVQGVRHPERLSIYTLLSLNITLCPLMWAFWHPHKGNFNWV